jgi:hypothetical protein
LLCFQERVSKASAGNLFQSCMVLFKKGIFSDICLLFSAYNYPIIIDPAQIAWLLQSITYGLSFPFFRVLFEERACAIYLTPLRQGFLLQIIPLVCKFSRFVLHLV